MSRNEYYNIGRGNVKTYGYHKVNIHVQTSERDKKMTGYEYYLHILVTIMIQYSLKQGMKRFGKKGRGINYERTNPAT